MSGSSAAAAAYARLYAPTIADQARSIAEISTGVSGQLDELSVRPTPELAETVAINLDGAARAVRRLRESLLREEGAREQ